MYAWVNQYTIITFLNAPMYGWSTYMNGSKMTHIGPRANGWANGWVTYSHHMRGASPQTNPNKNHHIQLGPVGSPRTWLDTWFFKPTKFTMVIVFVPQDLGLFWTLSKRPGFLRMIPTGTFFLQAWCAKKTKNGLQMGVVPLTTWTYKTSWDEPFLQKISWWLFSFQKIKGDSKNPQ